MFGTVPWEAVIPRNFGTLQDADTVEIGPYRRVRRLGEGSFGAVFEALHCETGDRVALKELTRGNPDALSRFKREFRGMQDLHHPNLVGLKELFEHEGRWVIAMELIRGTDWLSWVRPDAENENGPGFDEARLRASLRSVADGLVALHERGVVHRDLKPANILVEPEGRAVLVDFGLITAVDDPQQDIDSSGCGTVSYMAPEQAAGRKVGPAADWYAVGVSLYEALTGQLPVTGDNLMQVLLNKQKPVPQPPSACSRGVPADLDQLCMRLLVPDPQTRIAGTEVCAALGGQPTSRSSAVTMAPSPLVPFAGREGELELLRAAFEATCSGNARQVVVEGESGVGKSALVEEFLAGLRDSHPDAVVLRGRCYENERVPFKGFDGVVDDLAGHLSGMEDRDCARLLPRWAKVLEQLFPVLGKVRPLADKPLRGLAAEPTARRSAAIDTLRQLLVTLCAKQPLVLVVDDIQWSDVESFKIFEALTVHAERPPLLLLFTARPQGEVTAELREPLDALRTAPDAHVLSLRGLPEHDARQLAAHLLGPDAPAHLLRQISQESRGHPLFVAELAEFVQSGVSLSDLDSLRLDTVLATRIATLAPDELRLLRLIALATSPKPPHVFCEAAGANPHWPAVLARLMGLRFVRTGRSGRVLCYHDRVRKAVADAIEGQTSLAHHVALARAFAAQEVCDPAEVGLHFAQGGRRSEALRWMSEAAEKALEDLSFERAQWLYQRCLELSDHEGDDAVRCRLLVGHGHALARGGRSAQAAASYRQAAPLADAETSVQLRIWAAQHLLQSAQVQQGFAAAREVFDDIGVSMPVSGARALAGSLWTRAKLRFRGLEVSESGEPLSAADRLKLDAMISLGARISAIDVLSGFALTTQHLLLALSSGDAGHAAWALSAEALSQGISNPQRFPECLQLLERAHELAERSDDPLYRAGVLLQRGTIGSLADLDSVEADLDEAERVLREQCPEEPWLLTNVRSGQSMRLLQWCEHAQLAQKSAEWLHNAEERGDAYARASHQVAGGYVQHLLADAAERGLQEVQRAVGVWPSEPFSPFHFWEVPAVTTCSVYLGGSRAWQWHQAQQKRLDRAFMLKSGPPREMVSHCRAVAALAAMGADGSPGSDKLGAVVRREASFLMGRPGARARSMGLCLQAQLQALHDEPEQALQSARAATELAQSVHLLSTLPGSRYLEGLLQGGVTGTEQRERALQVFANQGYDNPRAAVRSFGLAGLDALEARYG